jgi:hypothetical protein
MTHPCNADIAIGAELDRCNAPCRRRAFVDNACTGKSPTANPAAEYQRRNVQSDSVFDIDQLARISRRTGAQFSGDIREAVAIHRPCLMKGLA